MDKLFKSLRIAVSTIIFLAFFSVFALNLPGYETIGKFLTSFQFLPALITFLTSFTLISLVSILIILSVTLIFGRVYCASFCPLGILQDIILYFTRKFSPSSNSKYQKSLNILKYSILTISGLVAIFGSLSLLNLIAPYSIFGRIIANIFKPGIVFVNNTVVNILTNNGIYSANFMDFHSTSVTLTLGTSLIFLFIIILTAVKGRKFCTAICPVGTILGLISNNSLFKISMDSDTCTECGLCEQGCRTSCIDVENKYIDNSRCTLCFDCLNTCPVNAINYNKLSQKSIDKATEVSPDSNKTRRSFIGGVISFLSLTLPLNAKDAGVEPEPAIPPGGNNLDSFLNKCTGCHLCVNACPANVIKPSLTEFGLQGFFQPVMDYNHSYCEYECTICTEVCPTDALSELDMKEKQLTRIGTATLYKDICVVYQNKEDCAACAELCPTHAVYTVEKENLRYPEMDIQYCIGCGACQFACPVEEKAIRVGGDEQHSKALPPFTGQDEEKTGKKQQSQSDTSEASQDFPF